MDSTKLRTLGKAENLSAWQRDQIAKNHENNQFFMQLNVKNIDPWAHFQIPEKRAIRNFIPNCPVRQTKKTTNDFLRDQKIMKSKEMFEGF